MINVILNIDVENNYVSITNVGHAEEDDKEQGTYACTAVSELMNFLYCYKCLRINDKNEKIVLEPGLTHLVFSNIADDESDIFWGLKEYLLNLEKRFNSISVKLTEKNFEKE